MPFPPRLSGVQWERVRQAWETDERQGFVWLVDQMGLPITRAAVRNKARREGWKKAHGFSADSVLKNLGKPSLENHAWKTLESKLGEQPCLSRDTHGPEANRAKPLPDDAEFMEAISSGLEFSEALKARVEFLGTLQGSPDFAFLAGAAVRSPAAMVAALEAITAAHIRDGGEVKTLVHGFSSALFEEIRERDATIEILMTLVEKQKKTRVQSKRDRR